MLLKWISAILSFGGQYACLHVFYVCKGDQKSVWHPHWELRRDPTREAGRSFSKPQHFKGNRRYTLGSWKDLCVFSCSRRRCTCMPASQSPCSPLGWSKIIRPWGGCGRVHLGPQHTTETSRKIWRSRSSLATSEFEHSLGCMSACLKGEKKITQTPALFPNTPATF